MKEPSNSLGHLYEALFNIGLLKTLKEKLSFQPYWVKEYENYPLIGYALKLYEKHHPTELLKKALSRVFLLYFLQGYTFGNALLSEVEKKNLKPEVFFYYGKPIPVEDDREFFLTRFGEKFGEHLKGFDSEEKGSLLHTDLILHLKVGELHYITVADLSLYGAKKLFGHYEYFRNEPTFHLGLEKISDFDLRAVKTGYLFKRINLKSGGNFQSLINKLLKLKGENPEEFKNLAGLILLKNREVAKLIQASSYAGEYLKLLLKAGIIDEKTPFVLRIFGITLHKIAQIGFDHKSEPEAVLTFLERAKELYHHFKDKGFDYSRFVDNFAQKLKENLKNQKPPVGVRITKSRWENLGERKLLYEHWEIEKEFRLNDEKRELHRKVFEKVLKNNLWVANLGVPGIGKTTTIFKLFGRNSLILYTSPRTFLNVDLIRRWTTENPNLVAFYTQSEFDDAVFYHSSDKNFSLPEELIVPKVGKVRLLKLHEEEDEEYSTVSAISKDASANKPVKEVGVLNRLLKTVAHLLEDKDKPLKGREIVVAFATQAIVRHRFGSTTFEHLKDFLSGKQKPAFGGDKLKKLLKERFLSNGINELVFVMDEITGSESGRSLFKAFAKENWFEELAEFSKKLGLNLRFSLLDASLKGFDIFKTFAEDEDTRPIIYFDLAGEKFKEGILQREVKLFNKNFKCLDAVGFPAGRLDVLYDFRPYGEKEELLKLLLETLKVHLNGGSKQIFLFLQDKKLLEKLRKKIVKDKLLREEEIFTVHSLSGKNREVDKKKTKLILATSSASRGITLPLIDTYVAVVPPFAIENNLTELVQVLFRGRGSIKTDDEKGSKTLEDRKRVIHLIFPVESENYQYHLARALEVANLLKSSLLTVTCGGASVKTPEGERLLTVSPVGIQREKVFHPQKEFERRLGNPKKVIAQLAKLGGEVSQKAHLLGKGLEELLQSATYKLPPEELRNILKLLEGAERSETLGDFYALPLEFKESEFVTVKGHYLILSTRTVRTEFSVYPKGRRYLLLLIEELSKLEPERTKGLKPLRDFLLKGKPFHLDLKPFGVERILIVPPLGWDFGNFDPNRDFSGSWSSPMRGLLYNFLGSVGNFYPEGEVEFERPFGITDLDKTLFDEVEKDFLKGGNVFVSNEVNLMELFLS